MLRTILKPLSFVPALIMMYIIFSFSAQDGDMSGQLSYQASVKIIETADYVFNANLSYDQIDEWANKIDFITRKLAHMTEYFALAIAVSFPLYVYGLHGILLMFLAGLICVGFACGDEFHQSFIAGRSPSARDVCIDSVGVFFGIIVVRIIGWTGRKTVFKEKVKVKQKKPKKKLFGGKSKTTYYDKYGNYQPPQPDDRYYQNPGSGYGYDNRGQDYGYDSRYDSRSGRNYYEQPGGNPNYGYDNRGGRDYYGQPEGNPNYGYDNRGGNPNYGYDGRSSNPNYGYDNRSGTPNYGYDNRSGNPNYGYDNHGHRDYYEQSGKNPETGYGYDNCEQNYCESQTPDRSNRDYYEQPVRESQSQQSTRTWSREEVEAGLHPEHTSRTSDKKATNPNDPFWSPEQEIDFNAKPEYAERNYQETNDPYDHDWGFDRSENVSRQPSYSPEKEQTPYENPESTVPDEPAEDPRQTPPVQHRRKKKHEMGVFSTEIKSEIEFRLKLNEKMHVLSSSDKNTCIFCFIIFRFLLIILFPVTLFFRCFLPASVSLLPSPAVLSQIAVIPVCALH